MTTIGSELTQKVLDASTRHTSANAIARELGTSAYKVRRVLSDNNVTLKQHIDPNAIPEHEHEHVVELLRGGMSRVDVAKRFNSTINAVKKVQDTTGFRKRAVSQPKRSNHLDGKERQIIVMYESGCSVNEIVTALTTTKTFLRHKFQELGIMPSERRKRKALTKAEMLECISLRLTTKESIKRLKTTPAVFRKFRKKYELSFRYDLAPKGEDLDRLIALFKLGKTAHEIAVEISSTPSLVTRAARQQGLIFRDRVKQRKIIPEHRIKDFKRLFERGDTKQQLATTFKTTTYVVNATVAHIGLSFDARDVQIARNNAVERINTFEHLNVIDASAYRTMYGLDIHVECLKCGHKWWDCYNTLRNGFCRGCSVRSKPELEISQFIDSIEGISVVRNTRTIISPLELDVYVPELKLAVEFNGIYWHSEKAGTPNNYHDQKMRRCLEKGIMLLQFFEDEWWHKRNIVESMIMHRLGRSTRRVFARKTSVVEVHSKQRQEFFARNHIDGDVPATKAWGLELDGELVSVISVRQPKHKKYNNAIEIARFASVLGTVVPGALGRLMVRVCEFSNDMNISQIVTYVDLRHGTGRGYEGVGFRLDHLTPPRFWWTDFKQRYDRFKFKADKENNLTQEQVAKTAGVWRIFGCSNALYIMDVR